MVGIESSDDRHAFLTPLVRVEFAWRDDRWVHALIPSGRCAGLPQVESLEGSLEHVDHARVISPVYQQAHVETGPDGIARMLLVGQSGPHHFSAAFAIEADETGTTVDADIADRCRSPIEALAATYRIGPTSAGLDYNARGDLTWSLADARSSLEAAGLPSPAISPSGRGGALHAQIIAAIDPASHTHRFRYRWRWSAG